MTFLTDFPTHVVPLNAGEGFEHIRMRFNDPEPQDVEHTPKLVHADHKPFTVMNWWMDGRIGWVGGCIERCITKYVKWINV